MKELIEIFLLIIIFVPILIFSFRFGYKDSKETLERMGKEYEDLLPLRTMLMGMCTFLICTIPLILLAMMTGVNVDTLAEIILRWIG